ncbi:MAG: methyltransferase domain-containing protein [Candidatus Aquilonibacter sp.]
MDFSNAGDPKSRELIEYLDFASRFSRDDKLRTFAVQQLDGGMIVLDVGCGTGDDVRAIAEIVGALGQVVGIDPSRAMIDEANARGLPSNAAFDVGSAYRLPYADERFDAVRADRVIQHLRQPDVAASELRRVSKSGGSVLLLDQDWGSLMIAGAETAATKRIVRTFCDHFARPWAGREAPGLLRRAGFANVDFTAMVSTPALPVAFVNILTPAVDAAVQAGTIDADAGEHWLHSLLEADQRGEFFCAVVVVIALGRVSRTAPA